MLHLNAGTHVIESSPAIKLILHPVKKALLQHHPSHVPYDYDGINGKI